ncbi:MAG: AI-2E family transporter [Acidobacteriaceae bacterium]|nr:AI-2E family transporter [Acidobacteriaceae bacterium]
MALFSPPLASQRSLRVGISVVALASVVALLYYGRDFFVTLIVSAMFAFILDPAVLLVMKVRVPRPAATLIVIGIALVGVYLLAATAWTQVATLGEDLPGYTSRLSELWGKANEQMDQFTQKSVDLIVPKTLREQGQQIQEKPQQALKARRRKAGASSQLAQSPSPPMVQEVRIHTEPKPVIATLYGYVSGYFHVLVMASFVPFLVYFMLSWRDHISKSFLHLFQGEDRYIVGKSWSRIGDSTRAYVVGNFILWVCLSSVSALAFFLLGVPYSPLIGPISAFFSLIPYVGLPLSIAPPVFAIIAIPTNFKIILTLVLLTAALHVVAMNLLYPKIIGRRVRLNPLVVTIALLFWGGVWGGIGLVLAVPITAAIKAVCDNVESLEPYGRILGD